jgi:outer membrane protein OmpA-like peptidoglycan-associated protein
MRIAFTAALLAVSVSAAAHDAPSGYWGNGTSKSIWKNSYGECWQTGTISKDQLAAGCEPKPAPVAVKPAPAPVVAAPAPAPVPAPAPKKEEPAPAPAAVVAAPAPAPVPPPPPVPPADSDKDGVPDTADKCNDTRKGAKVDETGCYIVLKEKVTVSIDVKFPSGKAVIDAAGEEEVRKLADFMNEYPTTTVEVGGHTDNAGNPATNKKLSQMRADVVRQTAIDKYGIDAARITAVGYGPDKPVADNGTPEGRALNRRVEGVVSQTVEKIAQ